jgi:hypothetical protein
MAEAELAWMPLLRFPAEPIGYRAKALYCGALLPMQHQ